MLSSVASPYKHARNTPTSSPTAPTFLSRPHAQTYLISGCSVQHGLRIQQMQHAHASTKVCRGSLSWQYNRRTCESANAQATNASQGSTHTRTPLRSRGGGAYVKSMLEYNDVNHLNMTAFAFFRDPTKGACIAARVKHPCWRRFDRIQHTVEVSATGAMKQTTASSHGDSTRARSQRLRCEFACRLLRCFTSKVHGIGGRHALHQMTQGPVTLGCLEPSRHPRPKPSVLGRRRTASS